MVSIGCYDYAHVCGHMYVCMYVDAITVAGRVYGNSDDLMLLLICNSVQV